MILGKPAPFVRAFVNVVDEAIREQSPSHGRSAMQRTWLAFCVTAVLSAWSMSSMILYRLTSLRINCKRFTKALHEVFAFGRSKKHMIQRQLGRLEPTPSLKYRADEVMRTIPVMSS